MGTHSEVKEDEERKKPSRRGRFFPAAPPGQAAEKQLHGLAGIFSVAASFLPPAFVVWLWVEDVVVSTWELWGVTRC